MILLTPAIRAIDEHFSEAGIDVIAGRHNASVIANNPRINRVITYDKSPVRLPRTLAAIRREKYDYYIDPKDHHSTESALIARIVRAAMNIGFNPDGRRNFDTPIPGESDNRGLHIVARHFRALEPLGIASPDPLPRPELFEDADSKEYVNKFAVEIGAERLVVVNISASQPKKMWPAAKWIEFLKSVDRRDAAWALSFAPPEAEIAREIGAESNIYIFRSRSMNDVISLVARSALVVTPDTAIVHVAAAFDRPLVAMFAGLSEFNRKFYPQSSRKELAMAATGAPGIRDIEVNELIRAYENLAGEGL